MAKENVSSKKTFKKAISKKEVVQKDISAKSTPKKVVKESPLDKVKVKKDVSKKTIVEPEMEDFLSEDKVSKKEIALKIWDIVFWIFIVMLALVWIIDFSRVKSEKNPIFCVNKQTIVFNDGTVEKCTGLGYRVYKYNRSSLDKGIEFGPFFTKMKEPSSKS